MRYYPSVSSYHTFLPFSPFVLESLCYQEGWKSFWKSQVEVKYIFHNSWGDQRYAFCPLEGIMVYLQVYLSSGKVTEFHSL